jgi:transcription elongation factor GreA
VFHRSWGVGLIRNIEDDVIRIDFVKKRGHEMSLKMAVSALSILPRDHIWVLKTTQKKEKLHDKVKGDPEWALKIVIRSLDNAADLKKIKSELVPSILTPGEWSSWSSKAREILKTDESFGNLPDRLDHFVVRDQPITLDEKIFNKFKAEKTFFDRVKSIGEFLHYADGDEEIGTDSDFFREMFDYFVGFLRSSTGVNEYVVSSFLLAERIVAEHPYLNPGVNLSFPELFEQIEDVEGVFSRIDNSDLKKEFLVAVRRNIDEWPSIYVRLFPHFLTREIIHDLERHGREEELAQLFHKTHEKYRDMREQFIWLIRNCEDDDWFQNLDVDKEKILINMIHLLDITFREISNRKDVSLNRKLNRQVQNYLLKENRLTDFVLNADEESVSRVYALVDDVEDLDPAVKLELRHKVVDRFPDFRFYGEQGPRETVSRGDFFTTASRYEEKQKELSHIHEVEVPQNSQEIAAAREYGDLRENAEYKAAKERQEMLNNTVARLKEDLERATIVRQRDVDTSRVSFGTIVKLTNLDSNEVEEYTVLGPWESDPNKHILSYLSPLGGELYGSKPGEELSFEINERTYNYRVETIEAAKLS